jgi:hypothetical protein
MAPEIIAVIITSAFAAFTGVGRALNTFNEKIQKKFNDLENKIHEVEEDMIRDYVLKQDFIREMNGLNQKLDRIWEFMIKQNQN